MVDNIGDHVVLPEKVVISKKKVITFLVVTCNATRDQHELIYVAVVPQYLFSFFTVPTDKIVWKTLLYCIDLNVKNLMKTLINS